MTANLLIQSLKRFAAAVSILLVLTGHGLAQTVVDETTSVLGTYTVTADGQVTITIAGADGGDGSNTDGGEGATITGVFNVSTGQVISYVVGAAGLTHNGSSAGGGGSTGVFIDSTLVLVAGAGGGGDNSTGAIGLGGNTGTSGDSGTGGGPGAGGIGGAGGGAGGGGNDSGGGGGINSAGASGVAGGGAQADLIPPLSFAAGGSGNGSGSAGGRGFTGGGGGDSFYSGGGGGYSGGGGAGANGSAGGGGSFVETTIGAYVSSTLNAGANGGGTESDGSILVVLAAMVADLATSKAVDNSFPNEGDTIVYTLTVNNNGNSGATNVIVTDTLPAGVTWVSTVPSQGSCSIPSGVTCELGSIADGGSATVTITATVNSGLGDSAIETNTADVTGDQDDPDLTNNTASVDITTCPANHIPNTASVTAFPEDDDLSNNSDHVCVEVIRTDYGDAPASYGDASHLISAALFLGAIRPDAEVATQGNDGLGDDNNGIDDEDGLSFRSPAGTDRSIFADVVVTNTTGGTVTVCGWLDIPSGGAADGDFLDPGEGLCQTTAVSGTLTFQWSSLPDDQSYSTYARFRVTSDTIDASSSTGGPLLDGEVEDYPVQFDFTPTVATIGTVELDALSIIDFLADIGVAQMDNASLLNLLKVWDPARASALSDADQNELLVALLDFLDPDLDGQVAVLRWDTLEERGTIGFFVERQTETGEWTRINNDMMPGLVMAPMGGEYMLADPSASPGISYQYQLIEQEANGNTRSYGPYTLEMPGE